MSLLTLKTDPSTKDLRWFGCAWFPLFSAVAGWLCWRGESPRAATVFWSLAGLSLILGAVRPRAIRPLFVGLIYLTAPIGWVVSHVVLALVYYLVLTPIGLVLRVLGRDTMKRRFEREAKTYWVSSQKERPLKSYFRQY